MYLDMTVINIWHFDYPFYDGISLFGIEHFNIKDKPLI